MIQAIPAGLATVPGAPRSVEAGARAVALVSLATAVAFEAWLGRVAYAPLPWQVALAAGGGFVFGRLSPTLAAAGLLPFLYALPAVMVLVLGVYWVPLFLLWSGALTGVLLADPGRLTWRVPERWRAALVLWALTIAVGWPIVALREADFASLSLLNRYNVPNTAIGGSPAFMISWTLDTAIVHLLGLLWFDWLFGQVGDRPSWFERRVALPLGAGAVVGSLLAVYQGLVDITYLSTGVWIEVNRAAGSLLDGNASGMIAALWLAGFLALTARGLPWPIGIAGSGVCCAGLWMTGSRTALVTAAIGAGAIALRWLLRRTRGRRVWALAGGALLAAVLLALSTSGATATGPLARLRGTLPLDGSISSIGAFGHALWHREGYGTAATELIATYPLVGTGIGTFNMMGAARLHQQERGVPPDNAQNWWRHHLAELGVLGAAGLLVWTVLFLGFLVRTGGAPGSELPAAAVKGALIGFGLVSLVGMPAQALPVSLTFWTFAFWYVQLAAPARPGIGVGMRGSGWLAVVAVTALYAAMTIVLARGELRPASRAAEGGWRYAYGMYDPPDAPPEGAWRRFTERRGAIVMPAAGEWMVLSIAARHPDLELHPVRAEVHVNGQRVLGATLHTAEPVLRAVQVGHAPRLLLESRVDRTWRPEGAPPIGLDLSWRFADSPPPGIPAIGHSGAR